MEELGEEKEMQDNVLKEKDFPFEPCDGRLVVEEIVDDVTEGGIHVPKDETRLDTRGRIVAVSTLMYNQQCGKMVEVKIGEPGEVVVFLKHTAVKIIVKGKEYLLLTPQVVLGREVIE